MSNEKQIAEVTDSVLAKVKTAKAKGLRGWDCVLAVSQDIQLECQASQAELSGGFSRVEVAFNRLNETAKADLLHFASRISEERNQTFESGLYKRFWDYSDQERACIATALQRIAAIREHFPKGLHRTEFHREKGRRQ